ncbi:MULTISPECIES: anti-sigma factor domain-containing protein [unclassified Streptomyces]|uniref:anti-sigma factor n=1 Tax=unclassified Streptomyces TaxID=2593676 RepID=UPI001F03D88E|nr:MULTISPECIES: anti-sigma factor [unclassified Streptomyces]MCH0563012.1 anti-sigma factor [Streptomyces sp. MUM 2J]MCH0571972.1 anti-sigma factor [Streptomyces sp. MUM 136J]
MTTADLHRMTGAYALDALPGEERATFERHLAACEPCTQEAAELSATAARLGLAVTVTAPAGMREQVLRRITAVRQQSPGPLTAARPGRTRLRVRRLSRWALAACLAAAAALGGTAVWQHQRAEDALRQERAAERRTDEIAAVLAAPDARAQAATLDGGATGTVVVSRSRDEAVFVVAGMEHPPGGKVYELWFDDGGTMRPAGLMDPSRTDQAVLLRGAVDGASGMGVTLEPAGGSARPSSEPIVRLAFPA